MGTGEVAKTKANGSKNGESKKNLGGSPGRLCINEMRTIAWCRDLERRTGKTATGLRTACLDLYTGEPTKKGKNKEFDFCSFEKGETVPTTGKLDQIDRLEFGSESRKVFEIGPEDQGEFVFFWLLFGNRLDDFWKAIDEVIPQPPPDCRATHMLAITKKRVNLNQMRGTPAEGSGA
ncbi:MAG: hypothetical protein M0T84_00735 [Betaproteobacteria bacterium]|nr:hypothetical protein [Betaproteobacteria bacterium]